MSPHIGVVDRNRIRRRLGFVVGSDDSIAHLFSHLLAKFVRLAIYSLLVQISLNLLSIAAFVGAETFGMALEPLIQFIVDPTSRELSQLGSRLEGAWR